MTGDQYLRTRTALSSLPADAQRRLAVNLAELVLPFASLSQRGQPDDGLIAVADIIRDSSADLPTIDDARHRLWSIPELRETEEPDGHAWYSLGATVAWIYAADAMSTAPSDGVVSAFGRVTDVLGAVDDELKDTDLLNQLLALLALVESSGSVKLSSLTPSVELAVGRLRSQ
ncbi:MAG: hypothetical protein HGA44_08725 [Cellulomonadaceae bacterium]|nr:hypothetical protein [Cellulomonadaceae bacterium]